MVERMAYGYSSTVRNNRLTQIVNALGTAGLLRIYSGSRPATGGAVTTKLAELALPNPAGAVSGGVLTFGTIAAVTILATGTATWFRLVDSSFTFVADGDVGATGSGKELEIDAVALVANAQLQVTSLTITEGNP